VLSRILEPKGNQIAGRWRKLHKKELHDLYSSPSITRIMKSRRMSWAGYVALMGEKRTVYKNGVFWDVTPCDSSKNRQILCISSQRASVASYG
jgi:hypothetical protein